MRTKFFIVGLILTLSLLETGSYSQGSNTPCTGGSAPILATPLAVNGSCVASAGTTVGAAYATNANNGGIPGCTTVGDPDVWFNFVAPASGNITIDTGPGTITNSGMSLYSGTCGSFTEIACDNNSGTGNMSQITQTGLTPGVTYWIRVWNVGAGTTGTFTICVVDNGAGGPPTNDDPCGATLVTAGASCSFSTFTTASATTTVGAPAPGCASYSGGDVWFQVVVPASGNLIFDSNTGNISDGGMAIYTGTCGALTLLACNDDGSTNGLMPMISQPGLTPGSTVWIRFWEYGNDVSGTFQLCVYDGGVIAVPANDDPCSATVVAVGSVCNYSTYSNANATATAGAPAPGCGSYLGGDVWFQVTVPAGGSLTFDTNVGTMTDGDIAIYSGTCGALSLLGCDDFSSANGLMGMLSNGTLVPGSTIWIRIWEYGNNNNGTFQLCVYETSPPPPLAGNVICSGMEPICSNTPITFTASTGGVDADVANPGNDYGCLFTSPNPTWYYMQMLTGGVMAINMSAGSDIDFAMWGPFPTLANAQSNCNTMGPPIDCSYSISATEQANIPAAVAGQVYVLLVTNYADVTQVIDLNTAGGNTATTDCSIILPIELVSVYATAEYYSNTVHWTTMSELSNDIFLVERSYDGTNFTKIGTVDGAGNSTVQLNYEFVDRDFTENLTYYRLKQVDFNGTASYSSIVTVNRDSETVLIYPNPTTNSITIDFPINQTGNFTIRYTDLIGKEFNETCELDGTIESFSSQIFNDIPAGIYFVEIRNQDGTLISVQRVVKGK